MALLPFRPLKWIRCDACRGLPSFQFSASYTPFRSRLRVRLGTDRQTDRRRPSSVVLHPVGSGYNNYFTSEFRNELGLLPRYHPPQTCCSTILWRLINCSTVLINVTHIKQNIVLNVRLLTARNIFFVYLFFLRSVDVVMMVCYAQHRQTRRQRIQWQVMACMNQSMQPAELWQTYSDIWNTHRKKNNLRRRVNKS